jgi:hypothetical protein
MPLGAIFTRCLSHIIVMLIMIGGTGKITGLNAATTSKSETMLIEIEKIKQESSSMQKAAHAYQLFFAIRQQPLNEITDEIVSELATLMGDPNDAVRLWVAMSLAHIGPHASASIPALESALKEIECIYGSVTSEPAIRFALAKMGRSPPHRECPKAE